LIKVGDETGRLEPIVGRRFPGIGEGLNLVSNFTGTIVDDIKILKTSLLYLESI